MKNLCRKTIAVASLFLCAFALFAKGAKEDAAKMMMESEPGYHYSAKIDYPVVENESKLNEFVYSEVKKSFEQFTAESKTKAGEIVNSEFAVTAGAVHKENDYISFVLYSYTYLTGSAHGSTALIPVNYSVQAQKIVSLEEFIKPASQDWLTKLSAEARKQLMAQVKAGKFNSDEETINNGTEPVAANFKNFEINKGYIRIIFEQYQVGPYSAGMPEIRIPFNFFK
jgi:Protein of unknown function (DUF3298).